MKDLTPDKFKEGMKIKYRLFSMDEDIEGRLHFENKRWFICQNEFSGLDCSKKYEYKYSWSIGSGSKYSLRIHNIEYITRATTLKEKTMILKNALILSNEINSKV